MELLTATHSKHISGVLSCFDRIILTGTLPQVCYAQGMTSYLYSKGIRIFDYPKFAEPFKDQLRANAEQLAKDNGIEIAFVAKSHIRKEDLVKKVLAVRGTHPGLVHIISAMESCGSYKPWHDKQSGKTFLKGAQKICDILDIEKIHRRLDELAKAYCPVLLSFNRAYHWSIMQAEYATDIVFKKQSYLQSMYSELTATAIHTVNPDNIATFLGHKVAPRYQGEMGNNYHVRIQGSRINIRWGKAQSKCMTNSPRSCALKPRQMTSAFLNTTGR